MTIKNFALNLPHKNDKFIKRVSYFLEYTHRLFAK